MFDFLKKALAGADFGGGPPAGEAASAPKRLPPPPKDAGPPVDAIGSSDTTAVSEVFSGMVEGGDAEAYGVASAPTKTPPPPSAHTLQRQRPIDLRDPDYRATDLEVNISQREGESDEDYLKKKQHAAKNFGDDVLYSDTEGFKGERDLSRRQRGYWNGFQDDNLSDKKLAALKIGLNEGNMALAHTTRVDDLESPAGRMETLNMLSQNMDPNDPNYKKTDEVSCAGASIVGGVLYAQGREGLKKLYSAVQAPNAKDEKPEEKALREKLNSGASLTLGDLQQLQQMVYGKLKENEGLDEAQMEEQVKIATESKDPVARGEAKKKLMVGAGGMEKFMDENEEIRKMFSANKLDLTAIDTDDDRGNSGDGAANHIVLRINGPDGQPIAYYDPWKKKGDQGQIINAEDASIERMGGQMPPAVLDDYKKSERLRGHYDQDKGQREYTEKILDKHGRPSDQAWWTDEQESEVRRLERG